MSAKKASFRLAFNHMAVRIRIRNTTETTISVVVKNFAPHVPL